MKTIMVAHRGAQGAIPENTIVAFQLAIDKGFKAVECDVRLTKDGKLVVIHDETVDRTTNGRGWVSKLTYKQIKIFLVEGTERIPTIEEVVEQVVILNNRKLIIELKADTSLHAKKAALSLAHYVYNLNKEAKNKIEVHSFWYEALRLFKGACPNVATAAIITGGFTAEKIKEIAEDAKSDGVSLGYEFLSRKIVKECHKAKLFVDTWAVSDGRIIHRLRPMSVDAIVENFTGSFVK